MATPRIAAGALYLDENGRVLLIQPTYKSHWDIPGGYVEPGESPLQACRREIREELGLTRPIGDLLVVDWAPADDEGDKLLFVFNGGTLSRDDLSGFQPSSEIAGWDFVGLDAMAGNVPDRLDRRIRTALAAHQTATMAYAERGLRVE